MLKRPITYTNFDGEKVTEDFYFNLSKPELVEFEAEFVNGMNGFIDKIIKTKDNNQLVQLFKRFILMSYGERSDDGRRFVKSIGDRNLGQEFYETPAYEALFMELTESEDALATFFIGVLPNDLQAKTAEAIKESATVTQLPEPSPTN